MPATRSGHAPPESSKGGGHGVPKESSMAGGGGVGGAAATSSVGSGVGGEVAGKVDREGTGTAVNSKAASSNVKSETSEKPPADGIGGGKMGAKHRLRAAATRLTNRMMETSMVSFFSSDIREIVQYSYTLVVMPGVEGAMRSPSYV